MATFKVSLLDYGAGNVRSVRNAILACGYEIEDITDPAQISQAKAIVFPGVGSYGSAMKVLKEKGFDKPLREYLAGSDRPYLGICLGMQTLFESSDEHEEGADAIPGLGVIPGKVIKFDEKKMDVPHIGWNGRILHKESPVLKYVSPEESAYFVHSYYAPITEENRDCILTSTTYSGQSFISSVQRGSVVATQFHPEKSGKTGLHVLKGFLEAIENGTLNKTSKLDFDPTAETKLAKRIVVALDVRTNDHGDLVVTKGDQYDVREKPEEGVVDGRGGVRNLGKPVSLAARYYEEGADEIAFLNITSFREGVVEDMPMLQVLEQASKSIFVPLTVGGGIRSYTDPKSGQTWSALEVAARYFRAGADKISIGSDAVHASESLIAQNGKKSGESSIEVISRVYGAQAVVISIDPKRVYAAIKDDVDKKHVVVDLDDGSSGPNGEKYCWYQCTVKGGREARDICAVTVAKSAQQLGAGEIMLNCIDMDGQGKGFDLPLMRAVSNAVSIPVIASSGAGNEGHFVEVFSETGVQAALAAGMFHRKEVAIQSCKSDMRKNKIEARNVCTEDD
ncbi:MAG: glutamine amidotransferase/cyclase [Bacillariaceae sp.]|jgi:glutamine amidotransferase/cyclase